MSASVQNNHMHNIISNYSNTEDLWISIVRKESKSRPKEGFTVSIPRIHGNPRLVAFATCVFADNCKPVQWPESTFQGTGKKDPCYIVTDMVGAMRSMELNADHISIGVWVRFRVLSSNWGGRHFRIQLQVCKASDPTVPVHVYVTPPIESISRCGVYAEATHLAPTCRPRTKAYKKMELMIASGIPSEQAHSIVMGSRKRKQTPPQIAKRKSARIQSNEFQTLPQAEVLEKRPSHPRAAKTVQGYPEYLAKDPETSPISYYNHSHLNSNPTQRHRKWFGSHEDSYKEEEEEEEEKEEKEQVASDVETLYDEGTEGQSLSYRVKLLEATVQGLLKTQNELVKALLQSTNSDADSDVCTEHSPDRPKANSIPDSETPAPAPKKLSRHMEFRLSFLEDEIDMKCPKIASMLPPTRASVRENTSSDVASYFADYAPAYYE